jgi:hypothetical protein
MKTIIQNCKFFARERDKRLVDMWQMENPKNLPLPEYYGVVKINNELVAAPLFKEFLELKGF